MLENAKNMEALAREAQEVRMFATKKADEHEALCLLVEHERKELEMKVVVVSVEADNLKSRVQLALSKQGRLEDELQKAHQGS